MRRGNWEQIQKYLMMFSLIGCIALLVSCGIKENAATGSKVVSDAAIGENDNEERNDKKQNNEQIKETPKATKENILANQTDKQSQNLQEGNTKVEFSIHNENSHAIMGVTLPKGWHYDFVGSTHENIRKDNKCCCSDPTESVRTACTCLSTGRDKESARICQNAFKGKGEQSTNKDLEEYGICLWKEENPKMKIQYLYHKDRLLFCGTGVTIGKETLNNAGTPLNGTPLKAESLMEEMENGVWYTLILDRTGFINGNEGDYAVQCEVEKKLWNKYQKEIKEIIEGITLSKCR
ncbi:MAG: hypothetical protein K2N51_03575 [Lachnospiraceae bacterium]|nr:hypothetical protein [Lachnospiraceae bacterium]